MNRVNNTGESGNNSIPLCVFEFSVEMKMSKIMNQVFYERGVPMIKIDEGWYQFDLCKYVYEVEQGKEDIKIKWTSRNSRYERRRNKSYTWDVEIVPRETGFQS